MAVRDVIIHRDPHERGVFHFYIHEQGDKEYLTTMPTWTIEGLLGGKFMDDLSSWFRLHGQDEPCPIDASAAIITDPDGDKPPLMG